MDSDADVLEDVPDPGWKDRIAAVKRAARALFTTRAEIFREELAEKGSHLGKAAVGLSFAAMFAVLGLLLLTALVAAVLARLFGGPIAGLLAVREQGSARDQGPASAEALAAERASAAPEDQESRVIDIEKRFRAGSE